MQIVIPVDEGLPASKSIVDVQEGVARGTTVEQVSDEEFLENDIKS